MNEIGGKCMKIRKKSEEPRDTVLTIRLSKSEQQELKRLAAKAGLSVGAFLLGLAMGDAIGDKVMDSLQDKMDKKP